MIRKALSLAMSLVSKKKFPTDKDEFFYDQRQRRSKDSIQLFSIDVNLQKKKNSRLGLSHPWFLDDSTISCLILAFFVWICFAMLEIQNLASILPPGCMPSLHYPQDRVNSTAVPLLL